MKTGSFKISRNLEFESFVDFGFDVGVVKPWWTGVGVEAAEVDGVDDSRRRVAVSVFTSSLTVVGLMNQV